MSDLYVQLPLAVINTAKCDFSLYSLPFTANLLLDFSVYTAQCGLSLWNLLLIQKVGAVPICFANYSAQMMVVFLLTSLHT